MPSCDVCVHECAHPRHPSELKSPHGPGEHSALVPVTGIPEPSEPSPSPNTPRRFPSEPAARVQRETARSGLFARLTCAQERWLTAAAKGCAFQPFLHAASQSNGAERAWASADATRVQQRVLPVPAEKSQTRSPTPLGPRAHPKGGH